MRNAASTTRGVASPGARPSARGGITQDPQVPAGETRECEASVLVSPQCFDAGATATIDDEAFLL